MKKNEQAAEPSYWAQYRYFVLVFIASVVVFVSAAWLAHYKVLAGWEHTWLVWVNSWPDSLSAGFLTVTMLGSVWAAAVLVMAAFVFKLYQLAWRLSLSVIVVYGLTLVVKQFIERPQPEVLAGEVHTRVVEVGLSFPSTHVAIATVLALTLVTYLPRLWRWPLVLLWIGLVAVSRLYLGINAPLDIVGGLALGIGVVCFWSILPAIGKRSLRLA